MIISDASNCGVTYDRHYDNHNSFIIQATGVFPGEKKVLYDCHLVMAQTTMPGLETMTKVAMKDRKVPNRRMRLSSRPLVLEPMIQTMEQPGNTKWGSIYVPLTSCLTGLESAV
jgi:hypothetical protein